MGTYLEYLMENSTYVRTNLIFNSYAGFFPTLGTGGIMGSLVLSLSIV